jgi:hypothetical protein
MYISDQRLSSFLGDISQPASQDIVNYLRAGGEIKKQLERNFRADDVTGYLDRRRKLRQAFELVPKSFAKHLLDQLLDQNEPLAKLFNYKISRHTRNEMISILLKKTGADF